MQRYHNRTSYTKRLLKLGDKNLIREISKINISNDMLGGLSEVRKMNTLTSKLKSQLRKVLMDFAIVKYGWVT